MHRIAIAALTTLLLGSGTVLADVVYLLNGETFEGVEAEVTETQVRIQLPIGRINLSRSDVLRVEESHSLVGEFRSREERLRSSEDSSAADWVELARWALRNSYEAGLRRAAPVAALLDPEAEGLAPLMRELHFVFEADLDRWIPRHTSMRRKLYAAAGGPSTTPGEPDLHERQLQQARADQAAVRRDAHLEKALEILQEQSRKAAPAPQVIVPVQGIVLATTFGFFPGSERTVDLPESVFGAGTRFQSATVDDLVGRIPGSFLPLR